MEVPQEINLCYPDRLAKELEKDENTGSYFENLAIFVKEERHKLRDLFFKPQNSLNPDAFNHVFDSCSDQVDRTLEQMWFSNFDGHGFTKKVEPLEEWIQNAGSLFEKCKQELKDIPLWKKTVCVGTFRYMIVRKVLSIHSHLEEVDSIYEQMKLVKLNCDRQRKRWCTERIKIEALLESIKSQMEGNEDLDGGLRQYLRYILLHRQLGSNLKSQTDSLKACNALMEKFLQITDSQNMRYRWLGKETRKMSKFLRYENFGNLLIWISRRLRNTCTSSCSVCSGANRRSRRQ